MPLLHQLVEQCLRLLEVGRVKALGEPAIERCQEVVRFLALALLLPQSAQARGGSQLPRSGLLTAGHGQCLLEAGFGLGCIWDGSPAAVTRPGADMPRPACSPGRSPLSLPGRRPAGAALLQSGRRLWQPPRAGPDRAVASSSCPMASKAAWAWRSCARPVALSPCMASAQPRHNVPNPTRTETPARSPGSEGRRPAPAPQAPHGDGDIARP